jgi:hypothetical protein
MSYTLLLHVSFAAALFVVALLFALLEIEIEGTEAASAPELE